MADAATTPAAPAPAGNDQTMVVSMLTVSGVATGKAFSMPRLENGSMSLSAAGTWGGATLVLEGSNDASFWKTCYLARTQATAGKQDAASWTADDAAKVFDDAFIYYRVKTTGGTGTSLTVTVAGQRRI